MKDQEAFTALASRYDFDSAILAARFRNGGETVDGEDSEPLPLTRAEPRISPEAWCAITGAALGIIAALAAVHRLGIF